MHFRKQFEFLNFKLRTGIISRCSTRVFIEHTRVATLWMMVDESSNCMIHFFKFELLSGLDKAAY